jgi:hypothetical protein
MINWEEIAKQNGLTPEEFTKEILTCAAAVGAIGLDDDHNMLKFTCSDGEGLLELTVRRMEG